MRRPREEICDNYVLLRQGDGRRYAELLLALAERAAGTPAWPASAGLFDSDGHNLERRVKRLLSPETNIMVRTNVGTTLLVAAAAVGVGASALIFTVRADAPARAQQQPERDRDSSAPVDAPAGAEEPPGDALPRGAIARMGTTRMRHSGYVNSVAFCDGGKTIVSGGWLGGSSRDDVHGIGLWDAATGRQRRQVRGTVVVVAPDGHSFAALSADQGSPIRLFDASGNEIRRFEKQPDVHTAAFSSDGKLLAAGGSDAPRDNQIKIWDVATGKDLPAPQLGPQYGYVEHMVFSPDNSLLYTEVDSGFGHLWDMSTLKEITRVDHEQLCRPFAFSPDGRSFASTDSAAKAIVVRETATGMERFRLPFKQWIPAGVFSPDFELLAAAYEDGSIGIWDVDMQTELRVLAGHRGAVTCLAFSADGKRLLSGSRDSTVQMWNVATGDALLSTPGHQGLISHVAVAPDAKTVFSAGRDGTVRLWNLSTGEEIRRLEHAGPVIGMAVSPDGSIVAAKAARHEEGSRIHLWDAATGRELRSWIAGPDWDESRDMAFSPDGRCLAVGSNSSRHEIPSEVILWDVTTGKEVARSLVPMSQAEHKQISFVAFAPAPDATTFAWSNFHFGHISEAATGKRLGGFEFFRTPSWCEKIVEGAFAPDGRTLLLNLAEDGVAVWDLAKEEEVRRIARRAPDPSTAWKSYYMALSPDGNTLATAGDAGKIVLWDVATGEQFAQWDSRQRLATALAWSADGKILVSGGADSTILVWDVAHLREQRP